MCHFGKWWGERGQEDDAVISAMKKTHCSVYKSVKAQIKITLIGYLCSSESVEAHVEFVMANTE